MKKIDIKHIGVPNVCFSLMAEGDERQLEATQERIERGFDDSETWSLTDTIANFIIPRLKRYQEIAGNILDREDEEVEKIDKFLRAMELTSRDEGVRTYSKEEEEELKEGLKLFPEIFLGLWW